MARYNIIDTKPDEAYSFPEEYSSILHITKTNDIIINGVNIITKNPTIGDILCITRNMTTNNTLAGPDSQDIIWVKGDTFNFNSFRGDLYEPVGVVYNIIGRTACVAYRTHDNCAYAGVKVYKINIAEDLIEGWPTDGYNVLLQSADEIILNETIKLSHKTKKGFIDEIGSYFLLPNYGAQYDKVNDCCLLYVPCDCNDVKLTINNKSVSLDYFHAFDIPIKYNMCKIRETGGVAFGGAVDLNAAVNYWGNIGDESLTNLNDNIYNIGHVSYKPVRRYAFENNTDDCKLLRDTFGTYENYIKEVEMIEWPSHTTLDCIGYSFGKGKTWTEMLTPYMYRVAGTLSKVVYTAAKYCQSISINHNKLIEGSWFMPTMSDIFEIFNNIDIINNTINRLNNGGDNSGFRFDTLTENDGSLIDCWVIECCERNYVWTYAGHSFIAKNTGETHNVIPVIQIEF